MKRDLAGLETREFDLLVVGAGIYGACVAWDAAQRGLSVALVDKGDIGHATSSNSLKIVHGGLRYLQDGDLRLVREMIRERTIFMRIAPHLVHPLRCVMPTYKGLMRSRLVMGAALVLNDLVGFDRNRLDDPEKQLPGGRLISRDDCLELLPGIDREGVTGGIIWYDCQMHNSERLTLSFALSAAREGASVANYVEVTDLSQVGDRVVGVRARDVISDRSLAIRAKMVVNATGPWVNRFLGLLTCRRHEERVCLSTAMNLVTRQVIRGCAAGLPTRGEARRTTAPSGGRSRLLFVVPWRGRSLIGTEHRPFRGHPDNYQVTDEDIQRFVDDVNDAYPGAALRREDVQHVHRGLLPAVARRSASDQGSVRLLRRGLILDHRNEDGIDGLVSVVGVKYTSARELAEKAVNLVFEKLGRRAPECRTDVVPLYGGKISRFDGYLAEERTKRAGVLDTTVVDHLVRNYGSEYARVLEHLDRNPEPNETGIDWSRVWRAEVVHAVREELAQRLTDVVLRRTELGTAGPPDEATLRLFADTMAAELGWDRATTEREVQQVISVYGPTRLQSGADARPVGGGR